MKNAIGCLGLTLFLTHCSHIDTHQRRFLDSTFHADNPPGWANNAKTTWEDGKMVKIKSSHSIKGNERLSGCFDLARLDTKEILLSEISNDVRGKIDNASQSLSENAEVILGKVRTSEFSGKISGLRFTEEYFDRYIVAETERVDCYVLGEISQSDYKKLQSEIVNRVVAADPRLKEAITKGQIDFFSKEDATPKNTQASAIPIKDLKK